jgi:hypothetical protein
MGFCCSRQGYSVRVDGLLLGQSRLVIQAAIEYDPLLTDAERERLAPIARLEAVLAIEGEEARGRRLGVRDLRIGVVGDETLYRLFRTRTAEPSRRMPVSAPMKRYRSHPSMNGRGVEAVS